MRNSSHAIIKKLSLYLWISILNTLQSIVCANISYSANIYETFIKYLLCNNDRIHYIIYLQYCYLPKCCSQYIKQEYNISTLIELWTFTFYVVFVILCTPSSYINVLWPKYSHTSISVSSNVFNFIFSLGLIELAYYFQSWLLTSSQKLKWKFVCSK